MGSAAGVAAVGVSVALALGGVWGVWGVAALIGPAAAFALATGSPIAAVPSLSGTASGLAGFLGTLVAARATQVVGTLADGTPVPVMVAMGVLATSSLLVAVASFGGAALHVAGPPSPRLTLASACCTRASSRSISRSMRRRAPLVRQFSRA